MTKPRFTPDPLPDGLDPTLRAYLQRQFDRAADWWPKDLEARVADLERTFKYISGVWPIVDYSTVEFNGSASAKELTKLGYLLLFGIPPNQVNYGEDYADLDSLSGIGLPVSGQQVHYFASNPDGLGLAAAGHLVALSTNGTTWTGPYNTGMRVNQRIATIRYVTDKWIAVGQSPNAVNAYRVATSTDGQTWTETIDNTTAGLLIGLGDSDEISKIALAVVESGTGIGKVLYSTNSGVTWNYASLPGATALSQRPTEVKYVNGIWFALGVRSKIWTSTDLVNWTLRLVGSGNQFGSIIDLNYGDGRYVAVTNGETGNPMYTSTDGFTWVSNGSFYSMNPYSLIFDETEKWAAVSGTNFAQSTNGLTWTLNTSYVWSLLDQIHKLTFIA